MASIYIYHHCLEPGLSSFTLTGNSGDFPGALAIIDFGIFVFWWAGSTFYPAIYPVADIFPDRILLIQTATSSYLNTVSISQRNSFLITTSSTDCSKSISIRYSIPILLRFAAGKGEKAD